MLAALLTCNAAKAQKVEVEYLAELQTDFHGQCRLSNLLKLDGEIGITKGVSLCLSTLSVVATRDRIADDMQVFSNIDSDDCLFTVSKAGAEWQIDECNSVFAGISNVNYDYFVSDVTSLFTNSSCGIFPTIAANSPVANYPLSAVGVHYRYDAKHWQVQASVYNGSGHNRFVGRDNLMRVCLSSDGVFTLAQVEHKGRSGNYFLGSSLFYGCLDESRRHSAHTVLWAYGEQKLSGRLSLIADISQAIGSELQCSRFAGLGGKYSAAGCEWGVFADYARFSDIDEWATELTCLVRLSDAVFVQPALHLINTDGQRHTAGLLRLGLNL
ncbi:MAG: hypothetical protein IKR18_11700 [Bacteroidaceae bacterium]|nr:hypothetical protein [Bacteroidaceae bacterium]